MAPSSPWQTPEPLKALRYQLDRHLLKLELDANQIRIRPFSDFHVVEAASDSGDFGGDDCLPRPNERFSCQVW
jgi:hypothetical protein